jgi:hypothetical protein
MYANYNALLYAAGYNSKSTSQLSQNYNSTNPETETIGLASVGNYSNINIHVLDYDDVPYYPGTTQVRQYLYNELSLTYTYLASATLDYVGLTTFSANTDKFYKFDAYNGTTLIGTTGNIRPVQSDYYIRIQRHTDTGSTNVIGSRTLVYTLTANNDTGICTMTWTNTSAYSRQMCMKVVDTTMSSAITTSGDLYYVCHTNSTGSLSYNTTGALGHSYSCTAIMQASNDGLYYILSSAQMNYPNIQDNIKTDGLILAFMIVGVSFFLGLWKPAVGVIIGSMAFVGLTIMGLIALPSAFIGGAVMVMAAVVVVQLRG